MLKLKFSLLLLVLLPPFALAANIEVLHFWTSGGEASALEVLKKQMTEEGHQWQDFVIHGGGGGNAKAELQARVLKGKPPAAAQIKGADIQRWARLGFLANLNQFAQSSGWDSTLPEVVANAMKYGDQYVAVPVNVHRINWLWANKVLLDSLDLKAPTTWEEFDEAADIIQKAGYRVFAHGNQAWQNATLFETVALSIGGPEYYRQAFVEHNFSSIKSATTQAVFERYYKLIDLIQFDENSEWTYATEQIIQGDAAFQIMGDWAKGEFLNAGFIPNRDFMCVPVPGTADQFIFNIDSFAMFKLRSQDSDPVEAQSALVRNIMSDSFQVAFNLNKGSIPASTNIPLTQFDACAQQSMKEFLSADSQHALVPSIAHGMATTSTIQEYFFEKIDELTNNPKTLSESSRELAKAIRYGQYILK